MIGEMDETPSIQDLLARLREGESEAGRELVRRTHSELYRIAKALMRGQSPSHTLQATALVHEAFLRLAGADAGVVNDLTHWVLRATRAMRTALIDHERHRRAEKRGGDWMQVSFPSGELADTRRGGSDDLLDLDAVLSKLEELDPELARVVEVKVFGGLELAETAALLGLSLRTAERRWRTARMWLVNELEAP